MDGKGSAKVNGRYSLNIAIYEYLPINPLKCICGFRILDQALKLVGRVYLNDRPGMCNSV